MGTPSLHSRRATGRLAIPILALLWPVPMLARATALAAPAPGRVPAAATPLASASRSRTATRVHARVRLVPSFSRQTGLACSACHYQFPQLTPFGRLFKLNGYTLTTLRPIGAPGDTAAQSLKLAPIPPLSAMVVAAITQARKAVPGTQNGTAAFPQELSAFLAGQVAPAVGTFLQLTYGGAEGRIGIDNADVRFASHREVAARDLLYGLTLHNNPTVQDVWNTTPAWSYPFMASASAPTPMASTLVDGQLAQQVLGLGAYSLWDNLLYTEVTAYRSAPQGGPAPLDSSAGNSIRNVAPYWRVALQHQYPTAYVMLGTYGLTASLYPTGVTGPTDRYADIGVDLQAEHAFGRGGALIGRTTYVHERQHLTAAAAESPPASQHPTNTVETFRANATYEPNTHYAITAGLFTTSGTTDTLRYAPAAVSGSATGRPNTTGGIGELAFNPWQNARLALQYVAYSRFNGGARAYDGSGRDAASNNTLLLYLWLAF